MIPKVLLTFLKQPLIGSTQEAHQLRQRVTLKEPFTTSKAPVTTSVVLVTTTHSQVACHEEHHLSMPLNVFEEAEI